jgi:hypothetical protein
VQEKLISKQESYAKEIVEFKQRIAEDYRQKIIEKAIDRATKAKLEVNFAHRLNILER